MASQEFIVLYTHQKMKKSKVWQDGILKISFSANKATLYDDKGQCLESLFLKQCEVKPGDDLESDRYLITVEDIKNAENISSNLEVKVEVPKLNVQGLKPSNKAKPCLPTGLKRKFTGFQAPRQVPKKMAAIENSESATLLLSKESYYPTFSSLFSCTPPLFSTPGKKNRDTVMPSDCNDVIDYKNSNTNDMSISLLLSTTSIPSNQKGFCDEDDYSFLNSITKKSDSSLDTEYIKEDCLTTRGSATSQNIRSKEQILALLKSKSAPTLEVTEHFPPKQLTEEIKGFPKPQCITEKEEEITEMNSTKNMTHQCHLENNVSRRSRWDIYLPKSLSISSSDVSDTEGKSKDQDDNLDIDLMVPFEQKKMDLFATDSEKRIGFKIDGQMDNDDQTPCNQKINFQVSSSCQNELEANLPDVYSNNEHHYLLSKFKSEMLFNDVYPKFTKEPVFTEENVQELNKPGMPERESHLKLSSQPEGKYPQKDSCISNNLAISDNLDTFVSKSRVENENIDTSTDLDSKPETFLEVTFNLDNFDTSDTEEESQNSNIFPLVSEQWLKKTEDKMCAKRTVSIEDTSQEDDNEYLSTLITINSSSPAKFCNKKPLSSQICTENSVDFDRFGKGNEASFLFNSNLPEVENVEEMTVDSSDCETLSRGTKWDSSAKQTDDVLIFGNDQCNGSVHPNFTDCEIVPSQSKSKDIENSFYLPSPSSISMTQTNEDDTSLFTKDSRHDCILGNYIQDGPLPVKNDRMPFLNTDQNCDSDSKCDIFDRSSTPISDTPFGGKKHPISKEIGVYEFQDTERMENLQSKVETNNEYKKYCDDAGNSFELSDLGNSISLLRSLTEYSSAFESLEKLKERNPDSKHHRIQLTSEPVKSTAKKQFTEICYSSDISERPNLYQNSTKQVLQENQDEIFVVPNGSFGSLQSSSLKDEEEKSFITFIPKGKEKKSLKPKPVEFQGHRVAGSASSEVMVRRPCSQLEWNQYPDSVENESITERPFFLTPKLPSSYMMSDFLQFSDRENFLEEDLNFRGEDDFQMTTDFIEDGNKNNISVLDFPFTNSGNALSSYSLDHNLKLSKWSSWETDKMMPSMQEISTLSPDPTFPLSTRNEDMINLPEESLKARTSFGVEKLNCSEKLDSQRFYRSLTPLITLPPCKGQSLSENCSHGMSFEVQESFNSSILNSYEESADSAVRYFDPQDKNRETPVSQTSGEVTPLRLSFFSPVPMQSKPSKWQKYQNTFQGDLITLPRDEMKMNENFLAASASGMPIHDPEDYQNETAKKIPEDSVNLELIKDMLHQQQPDFYCQQSVFRKKTLLQNLKQTSQSEEIQKILSQTAHNGHCVTGNTQEINASALSFPSGQRTKCAYVPKRQIHIPAIFQSPAQYKQVFTTSMIEHLNILLFEMSKRLHQALSKVDISFYTSLKAEKKKNIGNSSIPVCYHHQPAKMVMVKKEGPNKGRLFYACDAPKANQCKFFQWLEEANSTSLTQADVSCTVLHDIKSIGIYLRSQNLPLYEECQLLVRKGFDFQNKLYGRSKRFAHVNPEFHNQSKSKLYLKLSRKENSSFYGKDDLWVISKTLDFELDTFIACSAFFGPSSYNEVELLPLKGYYPSNWPSDMVVHALLVCNASTELTTLRNLQEHFSPTSLPIIQHLLTMSSQTEHSNNRINKRKFIPPAFNRNTNNCETLNPEATLQLADEMIQIYNLNMDQATALIRIAQMMLSHENISDPEEQHTIPITIIHGVFGAGKSYLLAVVILFLVQLFEKSPAPTGIDARPWKILISSSTNVAVDRVLLGLLSLGFEKFIRVGSIRKICKPILPYSLHAGLGSENEQLKELHALMKEDLTPVEKIYVRKSIEQHKLGTNRALLKQVQVVGVTCAACPFPCMNNLKFPVVILDECSQMTEPASLLPIARFDCEKLVLVGDPKQLPPTIQGSESAHDSGLEQTLFDRLCLMGHEAILLRTQYRCHPAISAIANDLFYEGNLKNGISEIERSPLLDWLPTLCFYNVKGIEQIERDNSFHNVAEAAFTLKLIQSLIASGIEGSMIGVITLYKSQMYKGAEKEIIILSCVRTKQVGFIDSEKRMNVALTRGKRHLLIVGNLDCLKKNRLWGRVIQHCEGREKGLQHSSECEPDLNLLLKSYLDKKAEERGKK
ncbi:5'-3' DNA helicase ZGRF1 isoform X3 [Macrotis lagotis]|uniref:5'-3' DNA helicase ZGRF1 isoform X3 n=1 Tax=Macrotis lagotis TaxID=92651 RepID=UPI003D69FA8A